MEDYLPQESGRYLKVILGSLNVSILDKDAKSNYKEQYEQFKLTINIIGKIFYNSLQLLSFSENYLILIYQNKLSLQREEVSMFQLYYFSNHNCYG